MESKTERKINAFAERRPAVMVMVGGILFVGGLCLLAILGAFMVRVADWSYNLFF